jgi:alkanesulfonate monooxygenase SsuD/methylene tetrahydromethanopterin reductase-like flavin-dependent oxidoreductase (luciferase family)
MRTDSAEPSARADLYTAAIEMSEWAETRGCLSVIVSEHHAVPDGYLPSPLPLAAALAARTTKVGINVSALLLALYEPVKLAEDMAVIDLISRGRVSYVVGIGYRDEEFELFGVPRRGRGEAVERHITLLRRLWSGESVEHDGRRVAITPLPYSKGGPMLAYGGGTPAAAERAGRLGLYFMANSADASLENVYRDAAEAAGVRALGCRLMDPAMPLTVFVSDDPDKAWAEIGEYLFNDAHSYASWHSGPGTPNVSFAGSVAELRAENCAYRIVTPEQGRAMIAAGQPLSLQPLVGGLPPDLAWPYLEAAAALSS